MSLFRVILVFGALLVLACGLAGCVTLPEETSYRQNQNTIVHTDRLGVVYLEQLVPDRWGAPITVRYIVDSVKPQP